MYPNCCDETCPHPPIEKNLKLYLRIMLVTITVFDLCNVGAKGLKLSLPLSITTLKMNSIYRECAGADQVILSFPRFELFPHLFEVILFSCFTETRKKEDISVACQLHVLIIVCNG